MLIDVRTAMLLTAGITFLLSIALAFTSWRQRGPQRQAAVLWLYATALQSLAWLLLGLRDLIPDLFSVLLGNTVLCLAYAQYARSLHAFNGHTGRWQLPNWIALCVIPPVAAYSWPQSNVQMRTVVTSTIVLLLCLIVAYEALRAPRPRSTSRLIIASPFLLGALLLLVRVVFEAVNPVPLTSGMASTPMQGLMFGYAALVPVIATFGFVLLCAEQTRAELEQLAATDPLTGALNRRMLEQLVSTQLAEARRRPRPLSVLLLDVDKFKNINDNFGHDAGDMVLKAVVAASRLQLRPGDLIGRLGGEEFLIVLDNTGEAEAVQVAERLRAAVADLDLGEGDCRVPLSISIGVASRKSERSDFGELVRRADRAMYAAKSAGRNRVVTGELEMPVGTVVQ